MLYISLIKLEEKATVLISWFSTLRMVSICPAGFSLGFYIISIYNLIATVFIN